MEHERKRPRPHDWVSFGGALAALGAGASFVAGAPLAGTVCAAVTIGSVLAARASSQQQAGPMPYAFRWVLFMPRWPLTTSRLQAVLEPTPGERVLEVGPGVGIYSLPIAAALTPGGTLEALDIQHDMLAALARRARRVGATNIVATQGDAQRLPYPDNAFDAAYLIGVLGEVPDPSAALRELQRVLKPGGRLVFGEVLVLDPDGIRFPVLSATVQAAGFVFERRFGTGFGYFARFRHLPS